jgi:hypothetical protein
MTGARGMYYSIDTVEKTKAMVPFILYWNRFFRLYVLMSNFLFDSKV